MPAKAGTHGKSKSNESYRRFNGRNERDLSDRPDLLQMPTVWAGYAQFRGAR
jgi:hypothetical protein